MKSARRVLARAGHRCSGRRTPGRGAAHAGSCGRRQSPCGRGRHGGAEPLLSAKVRSCSFSNICRIRGACMRGGTCQSGADRQSRPDLSICLGWFRRSKRPRSLRDKAGAPKLRRIAMPTMKPIAAAPPPVSHWPRSLRRDGELAVAAGSAMIRSTPLMKRSCRKASTPGAVTSAAIRGEIDGHGEPGTQLEAGSGAG